MELWGFEDLGFSNVSKYSLLYGGGAAGPAGSAGPGAPSDKSDNDAIPASHETFSSVPSADNLAKVGPQEFVVVFARDDPKKKQEIAKLITEGKPLETGYAYRLFYKEDGEPGVNTKEAAEMETAVRNLPQFDRLSSEEDQTPEIFYYENVDGKPVLRETNLSGVHSLAEQEADKDEVGDQTSAANALIANPTQVNLDKLKKKGLSLDALIDALLAALLSGNLNVIGALFDLVVEKSGLTVAKAAALVAERMTDNNVERQKITDLLIGAHKEYEAKKGSGTADITKANLQLGQVTRRDDALGRLLTQVMEMSGSLGTMAERISRALESMNRAGR